MGEDKATLEVRPGISQLDYLLGLLDTVCTKRAICVGSNPGSEREVSHEVDTLVDAAETSGPMAGVIAALRVARGLPVFVLACDMPFLEVAHIVQIANRRDASKLATSFLASDGKPEPMCSIYEAEALPLLEALAAEGRSSLRRFLEDADIERVEVSEGQFLASVNDRVELDRAIKMLRNS
ncbi:hypothetical protein VDG1235_4377 [Verrucomicrobiia bacterium DG1235]|nr:hypothetical protein VDG1235_4377 [Verrucomicrobiae bacterium DG1235]